jgi:hypothetical protein
MTKPIPIKIRAAIRRYASTHTTRETAEKFCVSQSYVSVVVNRPLYSVPQIKAPDLRAKEEPRVCKAWRCGRVLTRSEKLFGDRCISHSKILIV